MVFKMFSFRSQKIVSARLIVVGGGVMAITAEQCNITHYISLGELDLNIHFYKINVQICF